MRAALLLCGIAAAVLGTILARLINWPVIGTFDETRDPTDAAGDYGFLGFDGAHSKERTIPIVTATGATIRLRVAAPNGGN